MCFIQYTNSEIKRGLLAAMYKLYAIYLFLVGFVINFRTILNGDYNNPSLTKWHIHVQKIIA